MSAPARRPLAAALTVAAWVAVALAGGAGGARADACPALFAGGRTPQLANPKLGAETTALCYDAFAVLYSGVSRTPLYSAEHLTRDSVAAARTVARDDAFHEEPRLPADVRATLEDYVRSGYDRGHLSPSGDMPSASAQEQSFSLANIAPQDRTLNRGLWAEIEEGVRRLATERGDLYVVTGVIFAGNAVQSIKGDVLVPSQFYKAVYDPSTGGAGAYLARNGPDRDWQAVSIDALQAAAGVDAFPGLAPAARAGAMALPEPKAQAHARGDEARPRRESGGQSGGQGGWRDQLDAWLGREIARAARRMMREIVRSIF